MQNTNAPELQRILDWFLSFIKPTEWRDRKKEIKIRLAEIYSPKQSRQEANILESVSFPQHDRNCWTMSWYLYLAEMLLTEPTKYEAIQGARVMPIFERLGTDLELVHEIGGINKKVKS